MSPDDLDSLFSDPADKERYTCNFCHSDGYSGRILFRSTESTICAECVSHLSMKLYTFARFLNMEPENKTRH